MDSLTGAQQQALGTYTDLSAFDKLHAVASKDAKAALPEVARQFEAIFTQMMLKSMRAANFGDPMFGSQQEKTYQAMFDQQLSLSLSGKGKGIGIADMLVRQLGGANAAGATPVDTTLPGAMVTASPQVAAVGATHAPGALESATRALGAVLNVVSPAADAASNAISHWSVDGPTDFVKKVAPYARAAARQLGVSIRSVLAQAALETGWGKHMPTAADGSHSFNLFGIKAHGGWQGKRVNVPTVEYSNGVAVRKHEPFRAYASPAGSFRDYADLLSSQPRYADALNRGNDVAGFAHALVAGGYATDPAYAAKLQHIADSPAMRDALAALKNPAATPSQE